MCKRFESGELVTGRWAAPQKGAKPLHQMHRGNSCCATGTHWAAVGYRHVQGSWEGEIKHWQNRMLNCAAETKQALTRMPSEAPTKHILNVKAVPTSHWELWLDDHYLQTVMEQIYRQQEGRLKEGKWKDAKITRKQKAEHWKGGGEDFDRNSLAGTEGERKWESEREMEGEGQGVWNPLVTSLLNAFPVSQYWNLLFI